DTLSYGAATLSFALKNLQGPVVVTGSQRSSDRPSSDSFQNLMDSTFTAATGDFAEVVVCMHGSSDDQYSYLHRGTWVRKMHSSRRDAFQSITGPPIGRVNFRERKIEFSSSLAPIPERIERRQKKGKRIDSPRSEVIVDMAFEPKVGLVYTYPGIQPDIIELYAEKGYRGLVLAGTGLGQVPEQLLSPLRFAISNGGMTIVMTTQTLHGFVGMNVYERGRELLAMGILPGANLLPETAFVKLSFVLGHQEDNDPAKIAEMFQKDLVGESQNVERYFQYPGTPYQQIKPKAKTNSIAMTDSDD
ncbi:MAG TPA: asparaginase domain-containing protein, partial [Candidatus Hodarchaeales archaeon]|nr:asparaginase domain-containing protein [Candidatus Hodarchaeales archaeon]